MVAGGDINNRPTAVTGHMPFAGHRACSEWMGDAATGNRAGSGLDGSRVGESHYDIAHRVEAGSR